MTKTNLDALTIDELAALRDDVIEKLAEKVAARQVELEAEMEKLSQYGKPAKKVPTSTVAKGKKSGVPKDDEAGEPVARAA